MVQVHYPVWASQRNQSKSCRIFADQFLRMKICQNIAIYHKKSFLSFATKKALGILQCSARAKRFFLYSVSDLDPKSSTASNVIYDLFLEITYTYHHLFNQMLFEPLNLPLN